MPPPEPGNIPISYDILTLVINLLGSERCFDGLNACSQTCRMLLHLCRVHIFSTVSIGKTPSRLIASLTENSTIPKYVQELTYQPYITSEDLANALLLLDNIKTFKLGFAAVDVFDWDRLPSHIQHALAHLLLSPSMNRFHVGCVVNLPASLLSSCSTLKHLRLFDCRVVITEASDNILSAPPQLLSLDTSDNPPFVAPPPSVLLDSIHARRTASGRPMLDVSGLQLLIFNAYNRQSELSGTILTLIYNRDLRFAARYINTLNIWAMAPGTVLPSLRSLEFIWLNYSTTGALAFFALIQNLVALKSQPHSINELSLILPLYTSDSLDISWGWLDEVLAGRSGFPLERLTIQLWYSPHVSSEKAEIQARLEEIKTKLPLLCLAADSYLDFKFEAICGDELRIDRLRSEHYIPELFNLLA